MCIEVCFTYLAPKFSFAKSHDQNQLTRDDIYYQHLYLRMNFLPETGC